MLSNTSQTLFSGQNSFFGVGFIGGVYDRIRRHGQPWKIGQTLTLTPRVGLILLSSTDSNLYCRTVDCGADSSTQSFYHSFYAHHRNRPWWRIVIVVTSQIRAIRRGHRNASVHIAEHYLWVQVNRSPRALWKRGHKGISKSAEATALVYESARQYSQNCNKEKKDK